MKASRSLGVIICILISCALTSAQSPSGPAAPARMPDVLPTTGQTVEPWAPLPPVHDASGRPIEFHNITYHVASGQNLMLDVYENPSKNPSPVLVYLHGGGWWKNHRPTSYAAFQQLLATGFSLVVADYRLTGAAPAPASVEDTRCLLSWVRANSRRFHFDDRAVILFGNSSGAHLALLAGMLTTSEDYQTLRCQEQPKVAAILDFFGITDVSELLDGEHRKEWANRWIGDGPDRLELAKRMSPLSYVRPDLPPVFLVHGDADLSVPYTQSVRLAAALTAARVPNKLFTVPGGTHGRFSDQQLEEIWKSLAEFLVQNGVLHSKN